MVDQEDIFNNEEVKKEIFIDYSNSSDDYVKKENKKKKTKYIVVASILILVLMASMFVAGYFSGKQTSIEADMPMLVEAYNLVKKYYYKDISWEEFQVLATEGFFNSVDDFTFMSEYDYTTAKLSLGITISSTLYNEHKIDYIIPGSPVDKATASVYYSTDNLVTGGTEVLSPVSIDIGDKIFAISIEGLAPTKLEGASVSLLNAFVTRAEDVVLYIQKSDGEDKFLDGYYKFEISKEIIVTKQAFYFDSASINDATNTTSMIKLTAFQKTAVKDFAECVDKFLESGNTNLILDLRSNGGGDSQILGFIAGCLLNGAATEDVKLARYVYNAGNGVFKEQFFKTQSKYTDDDGVEYTTKNIPSLVNNFKVTILCNGGSASCSEVIIGALMHYNNSVIVGSKTYGKGVGQTVRPLSDGEHYVHITNGQYYIPTYENGNEVWTTSIHEVGFTPDKDNKIPTSSSRPYAKDLYIQRALKIMTE